MILDSPYISGSMSFGVANPLATIHISASTGTVLRVDGVGNNTGSLFVSSSGNVGIGTVNPVSKLQVEGGTLRIGDGAGGWSGFVFSSTLRQANNNNVTLLGALQVDSTAGNTSYISRSLAINKTTANATLDVSGSLLVSGSITATGNITAQTLVVQTITSSVSFITGSTKFGSLATNTHQFTGSMSVNGTISSTGPITGSAILVNQSGPGFITIGASGSYGSVSSGGAGATLYLNGSVRGGTTTAASNAVVFGTDGNFYISDSSTNNHKMFVSASGGVGIGTTAFSNSYTLMVANSTAAGAYIGVTNQTGSNGDRSLRMGFSSGATVATIQATRISVADDVNLALQAGGGNVGIGTLSPANILHVSSSLPRIISDTSTRFSVFNLYYQGAEKGAFYLDNQNKYIITEANGDNTYELQFKTANTTRMQVTSGGRIGMFTSSPSGSVSSNFVHIDGQSSGLRIGPCFPASNGSTDRDFLEILPGGVTTTILAPNEVFLISNPGGGAGSWETDVISGTGGVKLTNGSTSWAAITSDRRKKKNFEPSQGLAEVLQIEPVKYHFEWDDDSIPKRMGFIAQNIQPLIPEMVSTTREKAPDGSDYLTITPDYILPVLTKAIQELSAKLDAANAEIEILKNK